MEAPGIWGEIERSESYLVCSMYEEAESLSSSILKRILGNVDGSSEEALGDHQLHDMLESAGMVLVQSLHGLGRIDDIVNELRHVFGEVAAIPIQVLLTGICLQISNVCYSGVREILEEFFSIRVYKDNRYMLNDAGVRGEGFHGKISLDIDEYMEAVELYTFGVVGKDTNDVGKAISWVEKAALPEERRQGLLRRLHSVRALISANVREASSFEENSYAVVNNNKSLANLKNDEIDSVLKLSKQHEASSLWSSHPLSLRLGNAQISMSKGKIAISLVGLIICYALKRKRAALLRTIRRHMESTRKAIVDFWKLAFSYQIKNKWEIIAASLNTSGANARVNHRLLEDVAAIKSGRTPPDDPGLYTKPTGQILESKRSLILESKRSLMVNPNQNYAKLLEDLAAIDSGQIVGFEDKSHGGRCSSNQSILVIFPAIYRFCAHRVQWVRSSEVIATIMQSMMTILNPISGSDLQRSQRQLCSQL